MNMYQASFPIVALKRLVANPGRSATTIVSFPSCSQNRRARSIVFSPVVSPLTISTSGIRSGGLKKCSPITRSRCSVQLAIIVMLRAEVFDARIVSAGSERVEPFEDTPA